MTLHLTATRMDTPLGELLVVTDAEGALRAVDWTEHEPRMRRLLAAQYRGQPVALRDDPGPGPHHAALAAYFDGDLAAIDTLPVAARGTTFQRAVWDALHAIPAGETLSYGALAVRLGNPTATRAVGLANGSNPVGVVVPCHRVVGANGTLTGYGGGLHRKRWLLAHEGQRGRGRSS